MSVLLRASEPAPILAVLDSVRAQRGPAAVHGLAPGLVVEDRSGWLAAERFTDGSADTRPARRRPGALGRRSGRGGRAGLEVVRLLGDPAGRGRVRGRRAGTGHVRR